MTAADFKAFRTLYSNPFAEVVCPRCGSRLIYVVKGSYVDLENIYNIECSGTPRCWFYPIPPTVTPECIRRMHPDEIKTAGAFPVRCSSSCVVREHCTVEFKQEENDSL